MLCMGEIADLMQSLPANSAGNSCLPQACRQFDKPFLTYLFPDCRLL